MLVKIKKTVGLLLAICMVFSMMPMSLLSVFAATMSGSGTEADPYQITTADELKTISGSSHYKLMNDIALTGEWTPIGSFSGTLDGDGKTISGVNVSNSNTYCGFVEYLQTGGVIKNLTIYGQVTSTSVSYTRTGGFAGNNYGTITNCEFRGSVSQRQGDNMALGGIAGINYGTITNCRNYGDITGISTGSSVFVGGITGSNHGSVEITNCINYGTISGSVPNTNTNVGNIWGSTTWKSDGAYVGGIAGDTNKSNAPGCSNEGIVVGEDTDAAPVNLTGITKPSDITITSPVSKDEISTRLPSSVVLATAEGNRVGTVVWDTSSYDASNENAEYTFSGTVTLSSTVTNSNNIPLTTTITVTVGGGTVTPPAEPADYALYFKDGKLYKAAVATSGAIAKGDEYAEQTDKWSVEGNTLTLKGLEFETTASRALIMGNGTALSLQEDTESTLTSSATDGGGIYGEGGFTISGAGSVQASGTYGIVAVDLVIESGTVYATGTGTDSIGLYGAASSGEHSGIIKGGKVIASGDMYGIYGYGDDLHIEGGEIWATGNSDNYGALFVFNGTLTSSADVAVSVKGSTQYQAETLQDAVIHSEDVSFDSEMIPCGSVKIGNDFCKTVHIKVFGAHEHCVCGGKTNVGDHTAHQDVSYQPLDSSFTGGELSAGGYYLTKDITLTDDIKIESGVNLCLNGYKINAGDNIVWIYGESAEFNITDCTGTGSIQGTESYLIRNSYGTTNMFGIAVETTDTYGPLNFRGEMNVYGGSVKAESGGMVAQGGVLNIYGGEITAPSYGVTASSDAVVNITGGTIQATDSSRAPADVDLNGDATLYLGGTPNISKIWFGNPNQISAKCGGQDYSGGTIQLQSYALSANNIGNIIVSDVTKNVNDGKFSLNSEAYYLKPDGTNLIVAPVTHSVTLNGGMGYTLEAAPGSTSPVNYNKSFTFNFALAEGYSKTDKFAVKVNGEAVTLNNDGSYTISYITEDTTVTVEGVADTTAPTGEITVGTDKWHEFPNAITFGWFFKDTQNVEITAADPGSGVAKISYCLANGAMTEEELKNFTGWIEYADSFNIVPNNKYVIYAKLADNTGNTAYINTDGLVLDNIAPVISGIENGKTYCGAQSFTVAEENLDKVTINGTEISAVEGEYTASPAAGEQTIVVTDKAGNRTEMTITVNDGHTWGEYTSNSDATCTADGTKTAKCRFCNAADTGVDEGSMLAHTYGEWTDAKDGEHHIRACSCGAAETEAHKWDSGKVTKEATATEKGEKTYTCALCGATKTEEIPVLDEIPETGDNSNMWLWIALLFVSGAGLTGTVVTNKKRRINR